MVDGPVVVLRSDHDTALATFYRALSGTGEIGRGQARPTSGDEGRAGSRLAGRRTPGDVVATSALGAVGAHGLAAPGLDLLDVQRTGLPEQAIVNVDGSRVVRAREPLVGAHGDIHHREVAVLVAMAAGLLTGGPGGARPRRLDPLQAVAGGRR
jgi:hypothetical protein